MESAPILPREGSGWFGQRVLVAGLARSGLAAARLLMKAGAVPTLYDQKPREQLSPEVSVFVEIGCELRQAENVEKLLAGIDRLIISPGMPVDAPLVKAAQSRGMPVLGELELGSRCAKGPILAVTGTNGKTTTVTLLGEMLRQAGHVAHVTGNVGYPLCAAVLEAGEEDPLVVEVSSFQLETTQLFQPQISAVLNLSADHLNRHGTMDRYAQLKRRIAAKQTQRDAIVLNWDDPATQQMAQGLEPRVYWFSRTQRVSRGTYLEEGQLVFTDEGVRKAICQAEEVSLPGEHNLENALAASCMAMLFQVPPAVIRHALRSFSGVEHRLEFVLESKGIRYINDSKGTNPEATMRAIRAMQAPSLLLAGGYDKQLFFEELARCAAEQPLLRGVVLYGQTGERMEESFKQAGIQAVYVTETLDSALNKARSMAEPGYSILLSPACSSFDQFQDYEQRGRYYKQLVNQLAHGEKE